MSGGAFALYARAANWAIGSDPGLLRLRMAVRTTAALALALLILFLLTRATHQSLTVALLGVLITMVAGRAVNEPSPQSQKLTMALLPLPAALAITAAAFLAPHRVVADVMFVAVVFAAVYARRFGPRGRALGMVGFMAYFFTLYLQAKPAELPWLVGAVLVGTACSFVMTVYVLPDRPDWVLRATVRALRARMAIVIDTTAELVLAGHLDERQGRRLRLRTVGLNETALMVQSQIEDKVNPAAVWPGVSGEDLALWLFDAELTVERVATAGARAALADAEIPAATRADLAGALSQLSRAIRVPHPEGLQRAARLAQQLLDHPSDAAANPAVRRVALAIIAATSAASEVRAMVEEAVTETSAATTPDGGGPDEQEESPTGLLPTTRQAIQVAVAASLAIVVGELVSPARWYWAVIAAFVIFAGTNTWNETLTKGWARLIGTALGVPAGVLVAAVVSGNRTASLVLIFVCLFCSFYFMKVAYSLMTFFITTMLALLYGLRGQFSYGLLLLRMEETAIGAIIGVTVAILVLPTNARTSMRNDARVFLATLAEVIDASVASLFGHAPTVSPTEKARQLGRDLQEFRTSTKPLAAGVGGFSGRHSIRHARRMLTACDRYGRALARNSEPFEPPSARLAEAITSAATRIRHSIDALSAALDSDRAGIVTPATDFLDAAETVGREHADHPAREQLLAIVHALRQIDRAVVSAAIDLGADDVVASALRAVKPDHVG